MCRIESIFHVHQYNCSSSTGQITATAAIKVTYFTSGFCEK